MKKLIILTLFLVLAISSQAQTKRYSFAFWNVENLFDTIKSPGVYDEEFTPAGPNAWNGKKYWKKMSNLDQVLYDLSASAKGFPTVIGFSEVENRNVLEDLVSQPKIGRANYQIVHYDSPEARGVDVALVYRPDYFAYEGSTPIRMTVPGEPNFKTRDILLVWGRIEGERFCFFVNHWPSRRGGEEVSAYKRNRAADIVRHAVDSLLAADPTTKIVIMGDMNDDPYNASMAKHLGAKEKASTVEQKDLFNPFWEMNKKGLGTLAYNDRWNLFDNMVVSGTLLHAPAGELHLVKGDGNKYWGQIFSRPYMLQQSGQFKGYPLRTYVGSNFMGGYSDHFPVYIYVTK